MSIKLIFEAPNSHISLRFYELELALTTSFVNVRDGANASTPSIGYLTGTSRDKMTVTGPYDADQLASSLFLSSDSNMLVTFSTGADTETGFTAGFQACKCSPMIRDNNFKTSVITNVPMDIVSLVTAHVTMDSLVLHAT